MEKKLLYLTPRFTNSVWARLSQSSFSFKTASPVYHPDLDSMVLNTRYTGVLLFSEHHILSRSAVVRFKPEMELWTSKNKWQDRGRKFTGLKAKFTEEASTPAIVPSNPGMSTMAILWFL